MLIEIPNWRPMPLNKLMNCHWRKRQRLKKDDRDMVMSYCHRKPKATCKRRVTLTIHLGKGQRKCDPDAYWKTTLDALVHAEMLVNDTSRWVELIPVVQTRGDWVGTTIELEDLD